METLVGIHRPSNYDEMSMHESLLFADSLKVHNPSHVLHGCVVYWMLADTKPRPYALICLCFCLCI